MNIEKIKDEMLDLLKKKATVEELALLNTTVDELRRAETIHPVWPCDRVHQVAIVNEEAGEMVKAVLDECEKKGSDKEIKTEAVQTAAMCIRFLKHFDAE